MMDEYFEKKVSEKIKNAQKELEAGRVKLEVLKAKFSAVIDRIADMEAKYAADKAGGVVFDSAEAEELEAMFNEAKEVLAEQKQPRPRKRRGRLKGETDVG